MHIDLEQEKKKRKKVLELVRTVSGMKKTRIVYKEFTIRTSRIKNSGKNGSESSEKERMMWKKKKERRNGVKEEEKKDRK